MSPRIWKAFVLFLLLFSTTSFAPSGKEEKHIRVAMRLIGHEILLLSGDSTSRVLPIEKEDACYKIRFGADFLYNPRQLVSTVRRIVKKYHVAKRYLVEIEQCTSGEVVYSFEGGEGVDPDMVPCASRMPEKDCYGLYFTILEKGGVKTAISPNSSAKQQQAGNILAFVALITLFLLVGLFLYFRRKKQAANEDLIFIGKHRFDPKSMLLSYEGETTQLSGKEAELLILLHRHENQTIPRDEILKIVWDDEGDYIGRTLDVFISKLRKKLEADPAVKILNIRGVGYKLVVNVN